MDGDCRISCKYGLLPGKTEVLYTNLLEELDTLGSFTSDFVLLDYENALQNAVLTVWPGTTLRSEDTDALAWHGVVVALL